MLRWLAPLSLSLAFAQSTVPVPDVKPLSVTVESRPLEAAQFNLEPINLERAGYVEEEFILSGTATVYDWAASGEITAKASGPYANRILVRRPRDARRFSGTVIVELPNTARRFDWGILWSYSHPYFLEHGDAWVQITMAPSVESLKQFDPQRYAGLSWAAPMGSPCQNAVEDGMRWDIISQAVAAAKGGQLGFRAERAFLTSQSADTITYINAFHQRMKLADGKPVFDGYVLRNPLAPGRINSCAPAIRQDDPRAAIKYIDAPVISVVAQGELLAGLWQRKPDSDDPTGRYRHYEVAVASHIDRNAYRGFPSFPDQIKATGAAQGTPQWMFNARCEPEIRFQDLPLLGYVFNGAFANLDKWVKDGTPAPRAERIQTRRQDGQTVLVLDEFGIAKGGIRSPYADVPAARYTTNSTGPGNCREFGTTTPLEWPVLEKMYGIYDAYKKKFEAAVDAMLAGRWITAEDARRLKQQPLP